MYKNIEGENENFTVLSLSIQSINAKFDQLKILLYLIQENNCHISAICLQNNASLSIENYNLISKENNVLLMEV